jgi:hypothetical protein
MENNLVNNKNYTVILNKFVSADNEFIIDSLSLDFTDKEYTTVSTNNITSSEDIINSIHDMYVIDKNNMEKITYIETKIAENMLLN